MLFMLCIAVQPACCVWLQHLQKHCCNVLQLLVLGGLQQSAQCPCCLNPEALVVRDTVSAEDWEALRAKTEEPRQRLQAWNAQMCPDASMHKPSHCWNAGSAEGVGGLPFRRLQPA